MVCKAKRGRRHVKNSGIKEVKKAGRRKIVVSKNTKKVTVKKNRSIRKTMPTGISSRRIKANHAYNTTFRDKNNKVIRRVHKGKINKKRLSYKKKDTIKNSKVDIISIKSKILKKLDFILKTKRFKKICKTAFITLASLIALNIIDECSRKIVLNINGQEIEWAMDKGFDSTNYEYELFRNKERILLTKGCKFIESISLDEESPEKVSGVKVNKDEEKVVITWKVPDDIGSKYKYKVTAKNKSFGKSYSSKTSNVEVISGIEKYIIKIDEKEYHTIIPHFEIEVDSLQAGSHNVQIRAVDIAGNISEPKNITFKVDNTKFYLDDYKLATNNKDITNETHELYLVKENEVIKNGKTVIEKERLPISIGDNIAGFFISDKLPQMANPKYIYENDLVNVFWEENEFGVNNTEFYIECKSKKGFEKYKSDKMTYDNGNFLSGYYYKVTTDPLYTVKHTDSYTMDNMVTLDYRRFDRSKIHYFHVASVNEYGNISKTKTLEFDFENFTSTGEIKDAVRSLLYRGKDVDSDSYRKVTDDVYNTFTYKTIKKMKEEELKIILTSEDIKKYISENHNAVVTNKNAQYIKDDSVIVYNTNSSLEYLVKEIVKAFDEYPKSPWSKNSDFLKVYTEEKDKLGEKELTAQEFLSEAVWLYISDNEELSYKAPKTYKFLQKYYKMILSA